MSFTSGINYYASQAAQANGQPGVPPMPGQQAPEGSGYQNPMALPDYGANPWGGLAQQSAATAQTNSAQAQSNIQGMAGKLAGMYPTYQNSMGLGSGNFGQAQRQQAPPADNSRGMNPWSLSGEALAR